MNIFDASLVYENGKVFAAIGQGGLEIPAEFHKELITNGYVGKAVKVGSGVPKE